MYPSTEANVGQFEGQLSNVLESKSCLRDSQVLKLLTDKTMLMLDDELQSHVSLCEFMLKCSSVNRGGVISAQSINSPLCVRCCFEFLLKRSILAQIWKCALVEHKGLSYGKQETRRARDEKNNFLLCDAKKSRWWEIKETMPRHKNAPEHILQRSNASFPTQPECDAVLLSEGYRFGACCVSIHTLTSCFGSAVKGQIFAMTSLLWDSADLEIQHQQWVCVRQRKRCRNDLRLEIIHWSAASRQSRSEIIVVRTLFWIKLVLLSIVILFWLEGCYRHPSSPTALGTWWGDVQQLLSPLTTYWQYILLFC